MSSDKEIINSVFNRFIDQIEAQQFEKTEELLSQNAQLRCSAIGNAHGREAIKDLLDSKKITADSVKVRVFNSIISVGTDKACQSVYLIMLISSTVEGFMHIFNCGFMTVLEYTKSDKSWLIDSVTANMTFESGNSLHVSGKWKLIDYARFNGNDLNLLVGSKGAWKISNTYENDADAIRAVFCHYCWLIDAEDFDGLAEVYTEPYYMTNEKISGFSESVPVSVAQAVELFRKQRYRTLNYEGKTIPREACWNHLNHFQQLEINGDTADAVIYRYEPNRIGTRFIHRYNHKSIYYSGVWNIHFVKDNGCWRINRFAFKSEANEDVNENSKRVF